MKKLKKNEFRCSCCDELEVNKNPKMVDWSATREECCAVCKKCFKAIKESGSNTICAFRKVGKKRHGKSTKIKTSFSIDPDLKKMVEKKGKEELGIENFSEISAIVFLKWVKNNG